MEKLISRLTVMIMFVILCLVTYSLPSQALAASTFWVSPGGVDSNPGTQALPFQTLQAAADAATVAGDTVEVESGTYTNTATSSSGTNVLSIYYGGTSSAPITFEAAPGATPVISVGSNNLQGVQILANWIVFQGFTVVGDAQQLTVSEANSLNAANPYNPTTNGAGIVFSYFENPTILAHCVIANNVCHDLPGCGILSEFADYVTVENNSVYNCAHYSPLGCSGISIYGSHDVDTYTSYKTFVLQNFVYSNSQFVNTVGEPVAYDGEGIIIDTNNNSQTDNKAYGGRTLVENNCATSNGSAGIHIFNGNHVDVINNTCYANDQNPTTLEAPKGELSIQTDTDMFVYNNIGYAFGSSTPLSDILNVSNPNLNINDNDWYGGTNATTYGSSDIVANPDFVNPSAGNFQLTVGSPAIDTGTSSLAPSVDIYDDSRPQGAGYDRGAWEFVPAIPNGTYTLTPANNTGLRFNANGAGTASGTATSVYAANGTSGQKWIFTNIGDNTYTIKPSYDTSLTVDAQYSGTSPGTVVWLYTPNQTAAQKWNLVQNANGTFKIQASYDTSLVLNSTGTTNYASVQLGTDNGSTAEQWTIGVN